MIGTDEMSSSAGMDISESFRPEDISKSDFFDFVTATEMGIGVGVTGIDVNLQAQQHHQQQYTQQTTTHQQTQIHERLSTTNSNMTHDGGGTSGRIINDGSNNNNNSISNGSNNNNSDPTLQSYEFWNTDKDNSRLSSSIFEDLDRYCWQQPTTPTTTTQATLTHQQTHIQTPPAISTQSTSNNNTNNNNSNQCDPLNIRANQSAQNNRTTGNSNGSSISSQPISSPNTAPTTATSLQDNDGQIYTITVLNGNGTNGINDISGSSNEITTSTAAAATLPWLKREIDESHQLPTTLDLDSLLGNFSGYIKTEYPYDDSGFSTDGTKSDGLNGDLNGINNSIQQQQQQYDNGSGNSGNEQVLPSLVMSGFRAGLNIGQQLAAQFQNNNNDWQMIDHNAAEQNSAESLLRSALQGKGYTKGQHPMQNGQIALLPSSSPTVKDDEMRRILFSTEADSLAFADSTLNTAQIFEESQHHAQLIQLQNPATTPNGSMSQTNQSNLMVDDMFLSLENAFSDDFDKMKRIANEVQQYCHTPPMESDYMSSDFIMQISPTTVASTPTTPIPMNSSTNQLQPLHSPIAAHNVLTPQPTSPLTTSSKTTTMQIQQQHQQQQRKTEVTTSTTTAITTTAATPTNNHNINSTTKSTKKYKRTTSNNNNSSSNNNNLNVLNHNINSSNITTTTSTNNSSNNTNNGLATSTKNSNNNNSSSNSAVSSGSSSSSSNSPPTTHCNGQRKERSLHYCSICSKGFKDKYSVNVHIRTHTGEKPFACSLCGKSFRQKAHLAKHYQTHMAQKNQHAAGSGGGGGLAKGNTSKNQRTSTAGVLAHQQHQHQQQQQQQQQQQRQQLSLLSGGNSVVQMPSQMSLNGPNGVGIGGSTSAVTVGSINSGTVGISTLNTMGINPNLHGVTSTVVSLNGPANTACLPGNVLASTNGLLTNR